MNALSIAWKNLTLELLPYRGIWVPEVRCLFVADTHFGKATTFRQSGIPVPVGTTASMLETLDKMLIATNPKELIVLGDWIHHAKTASVDYVDELLAWRRRWQDLAITLVQGNHDRHNRRLLNQLEIDVVPEGELRDGLELRHYPQESADGDPRRSSKSAGESRVLKLCGHLHPAVSLPVAPKMTKRFPCFVVTTDQIILPAFGEFTGMATVEPKPGQRIVACVGNQLIEVPEPRVSKSQA